MCLVGRTAAKQGQKNRRWRFRRTEMRTAGPTAVRKRDAMALRGITVLVGLIRIDGRSIVMKSDFCSHHCPV
ncbi:hypothetical protein NDU88_000802 [Pleurodeles waltl]|uniref:Uncharacterized protein n=1 Tax=Pleurodeles waltl TaxID=8319 RepID=A0AAV7NCE4_PLEWA|nr:hypothetical protein NDU88_000802 [Pleurodeles waltl]